jgi:pimeloyl-ACP methyl ester carboxylesterase
MTAPAATPAPMRELVLDTPLGRIAGLRTGIAGAPKVLALHGWLDNAASFVPLAEHLPGIELVAPDLPGHGRSAHLAPGADYSFAGAVNAVLDIADALGWERFALLGHSMGAGIGSLLAAACPQRVARFVAIEALGALSEAPERTAGRLREAIAAARALPGKRLRVFPDIASAARARMQANALSEPVARLLVERGLVPVQADGEHRVDEQPAGYAWSSDPRLTLPTMVRMTEPQVHDLVRGIQCPTRVIHADPAQPYLPDALRRARAALLPRGELVVIAGGHHLHMEQPAEVAAAIGEFFSAQGGAG